MPMVQAGKSLRGSGEGGAWWRPRSLRASVRRRAPPAARGQGLAQAVGLTSGNQAPANAGEGGQRRRQQRRPGQLHAARELPGGPGRAPDARALLAPSSVAGAAPGTCRTARARGSARRAADDRIDAAGEQRRQCDEGQFGHGGKGRRVLARRPFDCASATCVTCCCATCGACRGAPLLRLLSPPPSRDFGALRSGRTVGVPVRAAAGLYPERRAPKCAPASRASQQQRVHGGRFFHGQHVPALGQPFEPRAREWRRPSRANIPAA